MEIPPPFLLSVYIFICDNISNSFQRKGDVIIYNKYVNRKYGKKGGFHDTSACAIDAYHYSNRRVLQGMKTPLFENIVLFILDQYNVHVHLTNYKSVITSNKQHLI